MNQVKSRLAVLIGALVTGGTNDAERLEVLSETSTPPHLLGAGGHRWNNSRKSAKQPDIGRAMEANDKE